MAPKCNAHLCYMYKKKKEEEEGGGNGKEHTFEPGKETSCGTMEDYLTSRPPFRRGGKSFFFPSS